MNTSSIIFSCAATVVILSCFFFITDLFCLVLLPNLIFLSNQSNYLCKWEKIHSVNNYAFYQINVRLFFVFIG